MRLSIDPKLQGGQGFPLSVYRQLSEHAKQINGITEGNISAVTNKATAAPTTGTHAQGDFIRNATPSEIGTAGNKYVITGWMCVADGEPGTWVQCRQLTGN